MYLESGYTYLVLLLRKYAEEIWVNQAHLNEERKLVQRWDAGLLLILPIHEYICFLSMRARVGENTKMLRRAKNATLIKQLLPDGANAPEKRGSPEPPMPWKTVICTLARYKTLPQHWSCHVCVDKNDSNFSWITVKEIFYIMINLKAQGYINRAPAYQRHATGAPYLRTFWLFLSWLLTSYWFSPGLQAKSGYYSGGEGGIVRL